MTAGWTALALGLSLYVESLASRFSLARRQHVLDADGWSAQAQAAEVARRWSTRCEARFAQFEAEDGPSGQLADLHTPPFPQPNSGGQP